ncbi:MAG: zf-HC2 domain-containing protein [Candidatus Solibacter sp.]
MNCAEWEERVVLHAGGDLAGAEASAVDRHLGECARCRMFFRGVRDSLAILQASHTEPASAAHFTAVRTRVLAEIERGRRPWWRLVWISGAVAMAALVAMAVLWPRGPLPQAPRIMASIPAAPLLLTTTPRRVASIPPTLRVQTSATARAEAPPRRTPLTIKLQTDDPNIVIYWIAD